MAHLWGRCADGCVRRYVVVVLYGAEFRLFRSLLDVLGGNPFSGHNINTIGNKAIDGLPGVVLQPFDPEHIAQPGVIGAQCRLVLLKIKDPGAC